jgi:hypothetical protein
MLRRAAAAKQEETTAVHAGEATGWWVLMEELLK